MRSSVDLNPFVLCVSNRLRLEFNKQHYFLWNPPRACLSLMIAYLKSRDTILISHDEWDLLYVLMSIHQAYE